MFGTHYWKKMSDAEFDAKFENMIEHQRDVHSLEDLSKMSKKRLETPWRAFEMPYYRWTVIDDFSENKGYVFLEANHAWSDGINIAAVLSVLSDDHSTEGLKPAKPVPLG